MYQFSPSLSSAPVPICTNSYPLKGVGNAPLSQPPHTLGTGAGAMTASGCQFQGAPPAVEQRNGTPMLSENIDNHLAVGQH